MFGAVEAGSVADLVDQVEQAIGMAEITAQNAPGGHPIFDAIDEGRELLAWLNDNAPLMASGVGERVRAKVDEVVGAIYDAAAGIRNDPTAPPPATIWPQVRALPWPWIGAGAAALIGVAILFQRRGRR